MSATITHNNYTGGVTLKPKKRSRQASYNIGDDDGDGIDEINPFHSEGSCFDSNSSSLSESAQSSASNFPQGPFPFSEKSK